MNMIAHRLSILGAGLVVCVLVLAPAAAMAQAAQPAEPASEQGGAAAKGTRQQRPAGGGIGFDGKVAPNIPSTKWTGKRLADGQPDVSGDWSNTIANHNNTTDPQGGIPGDPHAKPPKSSREDRAPSRVTDPVDGQLPYLPWARAKQIELAKGFFEGLKPEYIEPLARCAPDGIPKSFYWHGYEIRQYPGYVVFLFNSGSRIIYLNDPKHLPDSIKLWQGDSRGHWEGNTLVVDVSNLNSKARFGRTAEFTTDAVHVVERFVFDNDNRRYNYIATFTDPAAFSRPFTVTVPARRWTVADKSNGWHYEVPLANNPGKEPIGDHLERICVENNGGFGRIAVEPGNGLTSK